MFFFNTTPEQTNASQITTELDSWISLELYSTQKKRLLLIL